MYTFSFPERRWARREKDAGRRVKLLDQRYVGGATKKKEEERRTEDISLQDPPRGKKTGLFN